MNRFSVAVCVVVGGLALAALPGARGSTADQTFEPLANGFIQDLLRTRPELATELGDHRYDGELTDYSPQGVKARETLYRDTLRRLTAIDRTALTGPNRIDAEVLQLNLEGGLFEIEEERPQERDPLIYDRSVANSIYLLFARDVSPAPERLRGIAGRLRQIPRVLAEAKANLQHPPRVNTETAIQRIAGAVGLIQDDLQPLVDQVPGLRSQVDPLRAQAVAALRGYERWLQTELLPRSDGSFRLGEARFRRKLRYSLASDLSPEEIRRRAERELVTVTDEMYATALPLYDQLGAPGPAGQRGDRHFVVKAVLDHLADHHASAATIVPRAKEILASAMAFVRERDLVTLPTVPVNVIVAPVFARGVTVAYCDPPGALEPNGQTFFAIAPAPDDWPAPRRLSYYREYNDGMLHDLTVHEAMPGHYLQLAHANGFKAPTLVRTVFSSGSFIEGWAVYMEKTMAHEGFGGTPVKMQQLKMRLRVDINSLLDQGVHMGAMTQQEAMDLMMNRGFQEEGEAAGKWRRACLTSTQLSTYFVGATEHDDLRAAAERRWGDRFDLKRYHDRVISFGSPPVRMVRAEMGL